MKKVNLKRELIMAVWATLESLKDKKIGIRATYSIVKNKKSIASEIEAIQEASRPPEGFIQYEKSRIELCNNLCEKDNDGKPILDNGKFIFSREHLIEFNTQLKILQDEHKEVLEKTQQLDAQVANFLKEDIDVEIYEIDMDQFKDGDLTVSQMEVLIDAKIISDN